MSQAIFKRMGGPEVWARVSKGGTKRGGGEGKKVKRPIRRKRSLLEKNKKGEEERDDGKRADGRVV